MAKKAPLVVALMCTKGVGGQPLVNNQFQKEFSEKDCVDYGNVILTIILTTVIVSLTWFVYVMKLKLDFQAMTNVRGGHLAAEERQPRPLEEPPDPRRFAAEHGAYRDVGVQGPVNYTRWRATPRFQPLSDREWGAWPEGRAQR